MTFDFEEPPAPFLGEEGETESGDAPRFEVLPVAYEATVSYGAGTSDGPAALLRASENLELYDEELRAETWRCGIHTHPIVRSGAPPEEFLPELHDVYAKCAATGRVVTMLGGEHSVTLAAVRACHAEHSDLSVLQIDAHADLRESYAGSELSHACVMRRIVEFAPCVQVGIRSLSAPEAPLIDAGQSPEGSAIRTHWMHEGWPADLADRVVESLSPHVYITFDLDAFDPSLLPATGTPEPGGLNWPQATGLLREVFARRNVVGFDIVELAPREGDHASDFVAAKLLYRMMGYKARQAGWI